MTNIEPVPNISEDFIDAGKQGKISQRWWKWFQKWSSGQFWGSGTYEPVFLSGSVQVLGPNGTIQGYGAFQWGFLLPNPSGIPSEGLLMGGAGITQVVLITDEQIPGQKGITFIRSAGDASSVAPANWDGGDLLDFGGGTLNGIGGTAKYQGGTGVTVAGGPAQVVGGSSTSGIPGPVVFEAGQTGTAAGGLCQYIATKPPGAPLFGTHRFQFNSTFVFEMYPLGQLFLYLGGGFGLAGQPMVSGGPGGAVNWQTGFTGVITTAKLTGAGANGSMTFASGILISQVQAT